MFVLGIIFCLSFNSKKGYKGLYWGSTVNDAKKAGFKLTTMESSAERTYLDKLYSEPVEAYSVVSKEKNISAVQFHYYNGKLFFVTEMLSSIDFTTQKLESRYGNFSRQGIYFVGNQYTDAERANDGTIANMSISISSSNSSVIAKLYDWTVYKSVSYTGQQLSRGQKIKVSKSSFVGRFESMAEIIVGNLLQETSVKGKPSIAFSALTTDYQNARVDNYVTDSLAEAIFNTGKTRIIERANLEVILEEQKFQSSGLVNEATAKAIGMIAGVDFVCYGTLKDLGDSLTVKVRVVDVETGELCSMSSETVKKDEYLQGQPQTTVSVPKTSVSTISTTKETSRISSIGVHSMNNAWKVQSHEDAFLGCTYYTFIVNSSDKQFLFINYKKANNPANSKVSVGIHWTENNSWDVNNAGTYEIKGSNGKLVTKGLKTGESDREWNISSFYYARSPKESARWLVEMIKNSDKIAVRRDGLTRRFQTEGLEDKLAEYGISWSEVDLAMANEEF